MRANFHLRAIGFTVAVGLAGALQAQTYDFASSFSITNGNPNGVWTYGYTTTLGGAFNAFTTTMDFGNGITTWYTPGLSGDYTPGIYSNQSGQSHNNVANGEVALHSGPSGEYGVARFTSPTGNLFSITGSFGAGDHGTVDLFILKNGATLYSVSGATATESFNLNEALVAGDTLDFVVGYAGAYQFDSTPLSATISAVPEPASMAALSLGALALLRKRKPAKR